MKEQITEKLMQYLKNSEDFLLEQAPDVIRQALKYETISAYVTSSLMLCFLILSCVVWIYNWKNPALDKHGSREIHSFMLIFIPLMSAPMFFVQLCSSIDDLIKIYTAPKYYLIQLVLSLKN